MAEKREIKREIFALYSTVNARKKFFEFNYEKMALALMRHLNEIFQKVREKSIDLFEKGLEETLRKRRHQDARLGKLPERQKHCKLFLFR